MQTDEPKDRFLFPTARSVETHVGSVHRERLTLDVKSPEKGLYVLKRPVSSQFGSICAVTYVLVLINTHL